MSQNRPNILYIMDDQHRWDYLGSMGADFVKTPNLDRLAERGIQFTQCIDKLPGLRAISHCGRVGPATRSPGSAW